LIFAQRVQFSHMIAIKQSHDRCDAGDAERTVATIT